MRRRLAIVATHPIQYYTPWFRWIAARDDLQLRVFFLSDFSTRTFHDHGFGREISWDVPLVDGFDHEFVPNISTDPGSHHFRGLINPGLSKAIHDYDPDAVLLFGYKYQSLMHFLFRWRKGRRLLLFRGDSHRLARRSSMFANISLRALFRRFDRFLYVGQANREYFTQHAVPDRKLFFAPHAVDNARFFAAAERGAQLRDAFRTEHGISADSTVILFAGKFDALKCPDLLVEAFRRIPSDRDVVLLMVGSGALEQRLRDLAAGDSRVLFLPFQEQSTMPSVYAAADVTVLPSESESWGLCVNESFCMGVPAIVSTHVGCARDLVSPDATGLVFRAGDVEDLAAALLRATSDRDQLHRWGRAARARIEGYSYAAATAGLMAALQPV
jgi:glycosyltransferase involved in cell wall biosynthesis